MVEILPFLKNKRPPYWKSTYEFRFRPFSRNLHIILHQAIPNLVQIEAPIAEIWRHIHLSKWWPLRLNTTSGFVSVDVTAFRRSKSILANQILSRYLKWRLRYCFHGNPKWLGKGSKIFSKSRMCQYPGMPCNISWIQKCIFDACRQRLHNAGLICNQATALNRIMVPSCIWCAHNANRTTVHTSC